MISLLRAVTVVAALSLALLVSSPTARADSPEYVSIDFGIGPYEPDGNRAVFDQFFEDDRGPMVTLNSLFHIYRIPYVGPLGVTASVGWSRYSGRACLDAGCSQRVDETLNFDLYPLALEATLRVDVLQLEYSVPIFLEGGVGAEYVRFRESKGGVRESYGGAFGLRWHGRVGLFLDVFEPRAARSLDENHGINHSYLFFELRGSTATAAFPVADRFTWLGGLGLTF